MALTERDMDLVKLAAREAAFTAIKESDTTLRMTMREEARPVARAEALQITRVSMLKVVIIALVASGGTGAIIKLPEMLSAISAFLK